uniref:Receptor-mediated endocytosis protein 6 n=1 Tax=Romanomermis culicivorax TaxID=13658 RepID=A0A915KPT8_ROMCU
MQMAQQQQQQGVVLPDLVPGQIPEIPRLDLIAEEVIVPVTRSVGPILHTTASVTSSVPASGARAVAAFLESYGAPCDRSDTWSVDATASDSDADALRTDDRMKEFDEVAGGLGPGGSSIIPNNIAVSYGSSSVVSDVASVPSSTAKVDERRHSMAAFPGLTISPAEASDSSAAGRSTPVAIVTQKCDVRRCESLIPSMSGVGLSLANVQSTTSFGSQFRGGASSSNWSEMSTVGSFSQQSVTFSDDSSDAHCGNSGICSTDQLLNDSIEEKSPSTMANATTNFENHSLFKDEGSPNRFDISENTTGVTENMSMESSPRRRKSDTVDNKEIAIHKRSLNKQSVFSPANAKPLFIPNSSRTFDHIFDKDDKRRNFLKTFKLSNLKSKVKRSTTDHFLSSASHNNYEDSRNAGDVSVLVSSLPRATSLEFNSSSQFLSGETGDQILAKYRRKVQMNVDQINTESINPYYDPSNVTGCQAFLDVKRKLRLVLSSINVGTLAMGLNVLPSFNLSSLKNAKETELVQFLNVLLAEALNTSDKILSSQLREVLRCLSLFEAKGEKTLNREWLIEFCARLYLDQNCERQLKEFTDAFRALEVQDERTDFVERFLTSLHKKMMRDEMWHGAAEDQLKYAKLSVERYVMALIYACAFYPNGEADMSRDNVFFEAIKRLSSLLTPSYKGLQIPVELHGECPWPLAQAEISIINAYKTPRDRLGCVLRCCETIINLLRVSRMGKTPSADDIVPVLVFVLVKANPPALLSTVQYINGFYGRRLQGEEAYWWTQFCAAVEFIKVMVNTKE